MALRRSRFRTLLSKLLKTFAKLVCIRSYLNGYNQTR